VASEREVAEIARLYSLPLEDFTAERNKLAKRLRASGHRAQADEVQKLTKPSLPAWAVNQAVHADPNAAQRLVEAGEQLDLAQAAAVEGDPSKLREAMERHQRAVQAMAEVVDERLRAVGRANPAVHDRVEETLRAVANDAALRTEFSAGRISRDREAVGFGGAATTPTRTRAAKQGKGRDSSAARRKEIARQVERARRTLDAAVKRAERAQVQLDRARRRLEEERKRVEDAGKEQRKREDELTDARAAVAELEDDGDMLSQP
jgi:hypothetical protein